MAVHLLNESRGACLEGTVTRIKLMREMRRGEYAAVPNTSSSSSSADDLYSYYSSSSRSTHSSAATAAAAAAATAAAAAAAAAGVDTVDGTCFASSSAASSLSPFAPPVARIRFVALSATVPNYTDIAGQ